MKFLSLEGLKNYTSTLLSKVRSMLSAYIPLGGSTGITGTLRSTCEYQTTSANGLRIAHNNKGVMLRNDGNSTYFLITKDGDPYGDWNDLRPFIIDNTSGIIRFENGASGNLTCNASTSTKSNSIASTGFGDTNFTYYQSGEEFYDRTGWCHYLISNHGSGESYYNYVIGLPFWGSPIYRRQDGNPNNRSEWHKFHTTETITYGTSSLVLGEAVLQDGHIYLQYE
jgi:hypothetical protein